MGHPEGAGDESAATAAPSRAFQVGVVIPDTLGLVLAGAACLWDDVRELRQLGVDPAACTIIAVNDALFRWPGRVDHFATLHPEEMAWRAARRARCSYPGDYETWTRPYPFGYHARARLCDHVLGGWSEGSSGLFAVGVALEGLGLRRVLLAGCPMDASAHLGRGGGPWTGVETYWPAWLERAARLAPAVRSLSGRTRELLGEPDQKWLAGAAGPAVTSGP